MMKAFLFKETKVQCFEYGSVSINYSLSGTKLIIFRKGKTEKDHKRSWIIDDLPEDEINLLAKFILSNLGSKAKRSITDVDVVVEKKKDDEDDWN